MKVILIRSMLLLHCILNQSLINITRDLPIKI